MGSMLACGETARGTGVSSPDAAMDAPNAESAESSVDAADAGGDAAVGTEGADAEGGSKESAVADGGSDAGPFACGDAMVCDPSEICVHEFGCAGEGTLDGGCPEGLTYDSQNDNCVNLVPPPPTCVSPAPIRTFNDCCPSADIPGCDSVPAASQGRICRAACE